MTKNMTLSDRLRRFSILLALSFVLIVIVLFYSLNGVRENLDRIVEERFKQVVDNSHNSRDFGLLDTRLQLFANSFFGDDEFVARESKNLVSAFEGVRQRVANEQIAELIGLLEADFLVFLHHCEWINVLLSWRVGQDEDINEQMLLLQEIVTERIVDVTLAGGDVSYLEQLVQLLSGYRENLLEISKLNALEKKDSLLFGNADDPPPLQAQLEQLTLRLQTLTASEPPIDKYGRHLVSRLKYYQYLMRLYQLEMIQLGTLGRQMELRAAEILQAMEISDWQAVASADDTRQVIGHSIVSTLVLVLCLLSLLTGIVWFNLRQFFGRHIQTPMKQVRDRLEQFRDGDLDTPMALKRQDEWYDFEQVFNQMLVFMQENMAALVDSESRFRQIFTNATEGIFRTSISGQIVEINPAALKILGYESRDQALKSVYDFGSSHYENPQVRKNMLSRLYRYNQIRDFECLLLRQNGERFWASINNRLVRNSAGEIMYIEGTIHDISMRKAAQESLLKLQIYLQNIIDSMPSVLIGIDPDMKITLWNKRAEFEGGVAASKAIGTALEKTFRLIDPKHYLDALRTTLETAQPARLMKLKQATDSNQDTVRYFDMLIYPLSTEQNKGAVIHIDDVSERVSLEQMMVRSEKMQSVGSLAAGLAHEINNPLAAVLQNVQVLKHRISPALSKNSSVAEELGTTIEVIAEYCRQRGFEKMLDAIAGAGQRAAKIVENIQIFSRGGDTGFAPYALSELLERTLDLAASDYDMRHEFAFHKIRIQRDFQAVENLVCEPSQIQQVILSLLKNAAQALKGNAENPCISLRIFAPDAEHVCLEVEDNGPGMDAETVRCIFDPFYSTNQVGKGTGLGLSIAYFIVSQNHQGSLSVKTDVGQGTCFVLVLPLKQ